MTCISKSIILTGLLLACSPVHAAVLRHRSTRQTMSFIPGDRSRPVIQPRQQTRVASRPIRRGSHHVAREVPRTNESGEGDKAAASAPPGSGFKIVDGVLTYPAPARFQPKNLKTQ